jgi:hypothetical protein
MSLDEWIFNVALILYVYVYVYIYVCLCERVCVVYWYLMQ